VVGNFNGLPDWHPSVENSRGKRSMTTRGANRCGRSTRQHTSTFGPNCDKIVIAGGLRPAPGEWYCGGLWVMEVDSRDEARGWWRAIHIFAWPWKSYRLLVWARLLATNR